MSVFFFFVFGYRARYLLLTSEKKSSLSGLKSLFFEIVTALCVLVMVSPHFVVFLAEPRRASQRGVRLRRWPGCFFGEHRLHVERAFTRSGIRLGEVVSS